MAKKKTSKLPTAAEALSQVDKYYEDKKYIEEMNNAWSEDITEHAKLGVCSVTRGYYLGTDPLKKLELYEQYLISLGYTVRIKKEINGKVQLVEMTVSWGCPTEEAK